MSVIYDGAPNTPNVLVGTLFARENAKPTASGYHFYDFVMQTYDKDINKSVTLLSISIATKTPIDQRSFQTSQNGKTKMIIGVSLVFRGNLSSALNKYTDKNGVEVSKTVHTFFEGSGKLGDNNIVIPAPQGNMPAPQMPNAPVSGADDLPF